MADQNLQKIVADNLSKIGWQPKQPTLPAPKTQPVSASYTPTFWEDPKRLGKYYQSLSQMDEQQIQQLPPWINKDAIERAYSYMGQQSTNKNKPWYQWQPLNPTDPVARILQELTPPPKDRADISDAPLSNWTYEDYQKRLANTGILISRDAVAQMPEQAQYYLVTRKGNQPYYQLDQEDIKMVDNLAGANGDLARQLLQTAEANPTKQPPTVTTVVNDFIQNAQKTSPFLGGVANSIPMIVLSTLISGPMAGLGMAMVGGVLNTAIVGPEHATAGFRFGEAITGLPVGMKLKDVRQPAIQAFIQENPEWKERTLYDLHLFEETNKVEYTSTGLLTGEGKKNAITGIEKPTPLAWIGGKTEGQGIPNYKYNEIVREVVLSNNQNPNKIQDLNPAVVVLSYKPGMKVAQLKAAVEKEYVTNSAILRNQGDWFSKGGWFASKAFNIAQQLPEQAIGSVLGLTLGALIEAAGSGNWDNLKNLYKDWHSIEAMINASQLTYEVAGAQLVGKTFMPYTSENKVYAPGEKALAGLQAVQKIMYAWLQGDPVLKTKYASIQQIIQDYQMQYGTVGAISDLIAQQAINPLPILQMEMPKIGKALAEAKIWRDPVTGALTDNPVLAKAMASQMGHLEPGKYTLDWMQTHPGEEVPKQISNMVGDRLSAIGKSFTRSVTGLEWNPAEGKMTPSGVGFNQLVMNNDGEYVYPGFFTRMTNAIAGLERSGGIVKALKDYNIAIQDNAPGLPKIGNMWLYFSGMAYDEKSNLVADWLTPEGLASYKRRPSLLGPYRVNFIKWLYSATGESEARQALVKSFDTLKSMLAIEDDTMTPEMQVKYLRALAKVDGDSVDGISMQGYRNMKYGKALAVSMEDSAPQYEAILNSTWSDPNVTKNRTFFSDLLTKLGIKTDEFDLELRGSGKEKGATYFETIKSKLMADSSPEAQLLLQKINLLGLDKFKKAWSGFGSGDLPLTGSEFMHKMNGFVMDNFEHWLVNKFNLTKESGGKLFQFSQVLKALESIVLLKTNPLYFMKNFVDNNVAMFFTGVFGMRSQADMMGYWKAIGYDATRLNAGIGGIAGMGAEMEELTTGRIKQTYQLGEELRKSGRQLTPEGKPTQLQHISDVISSTSRKLKGFDYLSQKVEQMSSIQAMTAAFYNHWQKVARIGLGYDDIPQVTLQWLGQYGIDPQYFRNAVNGALNMDMINKKLGQTLTRAKVEFVADPETQTLLQGFGLWDETLAKVNAADTPEQIHQAFTDIRNNLGNQMAQTFAEKEAVNTFHAAADKVQAEGLAGGLMLYQEESTLAHLAANDHWDRMITLWDQAVKLKKSDRWDFVANELAKDSALYELPLKKSDSTMAGVFKAMGIEQAVLDGEMIDTLGAWVQRRSAWKYFYDNEGSLVRSIRDAVAGDRGALVVTENLFQMMLGDKYADTIGKTPVTADSDVLWGIYHKAMTEFYKTTLLIEGDATNRIGGVMTNRITAEFPEAATYSQRWMQGQTDNRNLYSAAMIYFRTGEDMLGSGTNTAWDALRVQIDTILGKTGASTDPVVRNKTWAEFINKVINPLNGRMAKQSQVDAYNVWMAAKGIAIKESGPAIELPATMPTPKPTIPEGVIPTPEAPKTQPVTVKDISGRQLNGSFPKEKFVVDSQLPENQGKAITYIRVYQEGKDIADVNTRYSNLIAQWLRDENYDAMNPKLNEIRRNGGTVTEPFYQISETEFVTYKISSNKGLGNLDHFFREFTDAYGNTDTRISVGQGADLTGAITNAWDAFSGNNDNLKFIAKTAATRVGNLAEGEGGALAIKAAIKSAEQRNKALAKARAVAAEPTVTYRDNQAYFNTDLTDADRLQVQRLANAYKEGGIGEPGRRGRATTDKWFERTARTATGEFYREFYRLYGGTEGEFAHLSFTRNDIAKRLGEIAAGTYKFKDTKIDTYLLDYLHQATIDPFVDSLALQVADPVYLWSHGNKDAAVELYDHYVNADADALDLHIRTNSEDEFQPTAPSAEEFFGPENASEAVDYWLKWQEKNTIILSKEEVPNTIAALKEADVVIITKEGKIIEPDDLPDIARTPDRKTANQYIVQASKADPKIANDFAMLAAVKKYNPEVDLTVYKKNGFAQAIADGKITPEMVTKTINGHAAKIGKLTDNQLQMQSAAKSFYHQTTQDIAGYLTAQGSEGGSYRRSSLVDDLVNNFGEDPIMARTQADVMDGLATYWAKRAGSTPDEWYGKHLGGFIKDGQEPIGLTPTEMKSVKVGQSGDNWTVTFNRDAHGQEFLNAKTVILKNDDGSFTVSSEGGKQTTYPTEAEAYGHAINYDPNRKDMYLNPKTIQFELDNAEEANALASGLKNGKILYQIDDNAFLKMKDWSVIVNNLEDGTEIQIFPARQPTKAPHQGYDPSENGVGFVKVVKEGDTLRVTQFEPYPNSELHYTAKDFIAEFQKNPINKQATIELDPRAIELKIPDTYGFSTDPIIRTGEAGFISPSGKTIHIGGSHESEANVILKFNGENPASESQALVSLMGRGYSRFVSSGNTLMFETTNIAKSMFQIQEFIQKNLVADPSIGKRTVVIDEGWTRGAKGLYTTADDFLMATGIQHDDRGNPVLIHGAGEPPQPTSNTITFKITNGTTSTAVQELIKLSNKTGIKLFSEIYSDQKRLPADVLRQWYQKLGFEIQPDGSVLYIPNRNPQQTVEFLKYYAAKNGFDKISFDPSFKMADVDVASNRDALIGGKSLFQLDPDSQVVKGFTEWTANSKAVVHAFQSADATTAIHEVSHVFLKSLVGVADDDIVVVTKWLSDEQGMKLPKNWVEADPGKYRAAHEAFAKMMEEHYFATTPKKTILTGIFNEFKQWFLDVYHKIKNEIKVTPDLQTVLDKWDAEIQPSLDYTPFSKTRKPGIIENDWNAKPPVVPTDQQNLYSTAELTGRPDTMPNAPDSYSQWTEAPMDQARYEAWRRDGLNRMTDLETKVTTTEQFDGTTQDYMRRQVQQTYPEWSTSQVETEVKTMSDQVNSWLWGSVQKQMRENKLATVQYAEAMRDYALLNYTRRTNFDNISGMIFPYIFWYTHSLWNWALRAVDNPNMLPLYFNLKNFQDKVTKREGYPSRLNGKIKIPMPFLKSYMGDGVFIDPLRVAYPFTQFYQPINQYTSDQTMQGNRTRSIIYDWIDQGVVGKEEGMAAIQSGSGPIWDKAVPAAKESLGTENATAFDYISMVTAPHMPLMWAYYALTNQSQKISQTPAEAVFRNLSAVVTNKPGGYNATGALRQLVGLPAVDPYTDYRIDRMLAGMATEQGLDISGKLVSIDDITNAMIDRRGAVYNEAQRRVGKMQAVRYFGSILYPDFYAAGEKEQRGLYDEYNSAVAKWQKGDDAAINDFFDKYPEYNAQLNVNRSVEDRLRTHLVDIIWEKYIPLSSLNRKEVQAQLGDVFVRSFLDKTTRSTDTISVQTLADWASLLGYNNLPETAQSNAANVRPLVLSAKEISAGVQTYYDEKEKRFPTLDKAFDIYNAFKTQEQKDAYTAINPIIDKFYAWSDDFLATHPELIKNILSEDSKYAKLPTDVQLQIYNYFRDRDRYYPNISAIESGYFDQTDKVTKRGYLNSHPELTNYWDWKNQYASLNPRAAVYILGEKKTSTLIGDRQNIPVLEEILGQMSPELRKELLASKYANQSIGEGGLTELKDIYSRYTEYFNSFDQFVQQMADNFETVIP